MKLNQRESGSINLIIIVVLVLALLGSVGYIAYDKFFANDSNLTNDSSSDDIEQTLANSSHNSEKIVSNGSSIMNPIYYSDDWSMTWDDNDGDPSFYEIFTFISKSDGEPVSITLQTTTKSFQWGGNCSDAVVDRIVSVDREPISGNPNLQFAAYVIYSEDENKYNYAIGIQEADDLTTNLKVGDNYNSLCERYFASGGFRIQTKDGGEAILSIGFRDSLNFQNTSYYKEELSLQEINDAMKSSNYLAAKEIVQSFSLTDK